MTRYRLVREPEEPSGLDFLVRKLGELVGATFDSAVIAATSMGGALAFRVNETTVAIICIVLGAIALLFALFAKKNFLALCGVPAFFCALFAFPYKKYDDDWTFWVFCGIIVWGISALGGWLFKED